MIRALVLQGSMDFVKSEPGLSGESFSPSHDEYHDINIKVEDLPIVEEEEEEEEEEEDPEPAISPSIETEHEVSSVCVRVTVCAPRSCMRVDCYTHEKAVRR